MTLDMDRPRYAVSLAVSWMVFGILLAGAAAQPAEWSAPELEVERAQRTPVPWTISFRNGGDDRMYNVTLSVIDTSGLRIEPLSRSLGDVPPNNTVTAQFSTSAPVAWRGIEPGLYNVSFLVTYRDSGGLDHSETRVAPVRVLPTGTRLSLTLSVGEATAKVGDRVTLRARLVDTNGDPIWQQSISYYFTNGTLLGSDYTDSQGIAEVDYVAKQAGTFQFQAKYVPVLSGLVGMTTYSGSESDTVTLTVPEELAMQPLLLAAVAVVIIVAASALLWRRRRSHTQP